MITLLQLEYFRKLAMTEHLTNTAQELHISQAALSAMIRNLEKELGVQLFNRSSRNICLSENGKTYLKYVDDALNSLEMGAAAFRMPINSTQTTVRVATGTSTAWAPLIRAFCAAYPQHKIIQKRLSPKQLKDALVERTADIIIASEDFEHNLQINGIEKTLFKTDSFCLCVSSQHHLAGRKSVYMEELRNEAFIAIDEPNTFHITLKKLFSQAGYTPHIAMKCDPYLRTALVASNFGVVVTSNLAASVDLLHPNLYIPIADEYATRNLCIFYNPKHTLSVAAKDFYDFCINYYSAMPTDSK